MMFHALSLFKQLDPSRRRPGKAPDCDDVINLVAHEKKLSVVILKHQLRCRANAARARQLAMYLSHTMLGISLHEVGVAFGRDRTTVSYACGLIEDLRENPKFDRDVLALEAQIGAWLELANG